MDLARERGNLRRLLKLRPRRRLAAVAKLFVRLHAFRERGVTPKLQLHELATIAEQNHMNKRRRLLQQAAWKSA